MQIFCLHPFFVIGAFRNSLFNFIVSFAVFAAVEMLLLLRLQLFATVVFSLALGDTEVRGDGAEKFYRVVIHEPFVKHEYLYHFEYCFREQPAYSDDCWVTDMPFRIHKKVKDYDIT